MAEKNQKIHNLIDASLHNLDGLADVDTVIGKPIVTASGFQVIPFSKVTLVLILELGKNSTTLFSLKISIYFCKQN